MITASPEAFRFEVPFVIARGARTEVQVVTALVARNGARGWAECVPYPHYGESIESVIAQIDSLPAGITRAELQEALPAGAARNAVDCALWDCEAKLSGRRVWDLAGLPAPKPRLTAFTLSLGAPDAMERAARQNAHRPLLKIKLGGADDMPRLEAVRRGAPKARIIIDANEAWDGALYDELAPHLLRLGVEMVEQPLPASDDDPLLGRPRPVPVCADESCHTRADLPRLRGKYDMINIKTDKTGGLTEALALCDAARAQGLGVMVGCMAASSLAMAPAVLVAQSAKVVDLDGPLLLAEDREHALHYDAQGVHPSSSALWG